MIRLIFRVAFILGLVIWLVPVDEQDKATTSSLDTFQAMRAAGSTWSDVQNFCERQQEACAVGAATLESMGQRAAAVARKVSGYLDTHYARAPETSQATSPSRPQGRPDTRPAPQRPSSPPLRRGADEHGTSQHSAYPGTLTPSLRGSQGG